MMFFHDDYCIFICIITIPLHVFNFISLTAKDIWSLCYIALLNSSVISLTVMFELALDKPANQSSTFEMYHAQYAVDGKRGTDFIYDNCAHTGEQEQHIP